MVDALPEGAVPQAGFSLELLQTWPERPPFELIQQRLRELWARRLREGTRPAAPAGLLPPFALFGLGEGAKAIPGGHTFGYHDGDTYVLETELRYRGHQIRTVERCRLETATTLAYSIDIAGPGGARAVHTFSFDLTKEP